jgi:hypothetical protein
MNELELEGSGGKKRMLHEEERGKDRHMTKNTKSN